MENTIKLELSLEEVNTILNIFGDLPTKTGIWPLAIKIRDQADARNAEKVEVEVVE